MDIITASDISVYNYGNLLSMQFYRMPVTCVKPERASAEVCGAAEK